MDANKESQVDNSKVEKPKLDPETNRLQVSLKKPTRHFILLAKIFLAKFETVELHALGEATQVAVRVADFMNKDKLTTTFNIKTERAHPNPEKPNAWKNKLIVTLKRTEDFKFEDKAAK